MWFAKSLKSIHKNFFQFPQLTVLHPYDDGTVPVTCRGEDGWEGLIRQNYNCWLTLILIIVVRHLCLAMVVGGRRPAVVNNHFLLWLGFQRGYHSIYSATNQTETN